MGMNSAAHGAAGGAAKLAFEYSLKNLLWKQAAFYAERLVAERPCDETPLPELLQTYLLGLAYFHNQGNKLPEARPLDVLAGWDLAEDALLPSSAGGNLNEVVNGAAGLFLLGQALRPLLEVLDIHVPCLAACQALVNCWSRIFDLQDMALSARGILRGVKVF
ncbi:hypothetical protein AK812_SmicGene22908 [Symbiodinium microadriaticum]|uniref:Uncharacterized protein n=1 Tax=Symbiodinium microadriaticum TaxID=2951 RepID=A0A1Q9DIL5_SYMMI|nr:hypothetical protein AK812_SmicGene22908 [Symbiodinium microadriaticum]